MTIMTNKKEKNAFHQEKETDFPFQSKAFWAVLQITEQPRVYV